MLDAQDLQAIQAMIDAAEARITKNTTAQIGAAEERKQIPRSKIEELEDEVKFLRSIIRQISDDVQKLKKAN